MSTRISHSLLDPFIMPFVPVLYRSLRIPGRFPPEGIILIAVLNHRSGTISGVAAVYNRYSYLEEKRQALEVWAQYVAGLAADNVVPLHG